MYWLSDSIAVDVMDDKYYFHSNKGWNEGSECKFHPMDGRVDSTRPHSIKVYYSKKERDRAHYLQKKLSLMGLAPPVGGKFNFFLIHKDKLNVKTMYGLFTCKAKIEHDKPEWWGAGFLKKIKDLGFDPLEFDRCYYNVGSWKGRPVIIDFGTLSYQRVHKDTCPSCMFCEVMDEV